MACSGCGRHRRHLQPRQLDQSTPRLQHVRLAFEHVQIIHLAWCSCEARHPSRLSVELLSQFWTQRAKTQLCLLDKCVFVRSPPARRVSLVLTTFWSLATVGPLPCSLKCARVFSVVGVVVRPEQTGCRCIAAMAREGSKAAHVLEKDCAKHMILLAWLRGCVVGARERRWRGLERRRTSLTAR